MTNVRGLFSELFAYVLLFEQMRLQGEYQPAYEQVRRDITTLLEQQEALAKRQGVPPQDYDAARFAVLAWTDETILKHTDWRHYGQWNALPLQLEYYQTRNAGEELFEWLDRLRPEQQEIREIYYLCLGLGFSGRYFLGPEDELKLNRIRHEQARLLALPVKEVQELDKLTPQPYDVRPTEGRPIRPPPTRHLLQAGLVVLIAVPLVLFLVYLFLPSTKSTKSEASLEVLVQQWLAQHQDSFACAKVAVTAVEAQTGRVSLEGRAASEAQRDAIRDSVRSIKGVAQVDAPLQIIPWPFCEVVALLEPLQDRAKAQPADLSMRLNKPGPTPVYYSRDNLVIEVQTPKAFGSYVYVDYYTVDKLVGHLLPNPDEQANMYRPGSLVVVGNPPRQWLIYPPPGLELVTVIASKTPLFLPPRPNDEPVEAYLPLLRQALQKASPSETGGVFSFISNQAQP